MGTVACKNGVAFRSLWLAAMAVVVSFASWAFSRELDQQAEANQQFTGRISELEVGAAAYRSDMHHVVGDVAELTTTVGEVKDIVTEIQAYLKAQE